MQLILQYRALEDRREQKVDGEIDRSYRNSCTTFFAGSLADIIQCGGTDSKIPFQFVQGHQLAFYLDVLYSCTS